MLLAKLEPLIPEQVREWQQSLEVATPDVRDLLSRHIRQLAQEKFGDYHNKLLISLPPKDRARGTLNLGTVLYDQPRWDVGISSKEFLQNLAIFGRSGAGKTNVAFHLLLQLAKRKVPLLFLDFKRTARHLLPALPRGQRLQVFTVGRGVSPFPFNPFIVPPNVERDLYVNHLVDVMASAYTLGDGAKYLLHNALKSTFEQNSAPSLDQLVDALDQLEAKGRVAGWRVTAMRALESLRCLEHDHVTRKQQRDFAQSLLSQNNVVELDALSQSAKSFLVPLLCFWIYSVQMTKPARETLQFVIFLEEAHHVLYRQEHRAKEGLMNQLLRQGRELGMSFVIVDQHPHLMAPAALGNCMTSICLNQKDPADINKAAGLSLLDEADKHWLSRLPIGQGIVKLQDRWNQPFLVQFPHISIQKGQVTDELLSNYMAGKRLGSLGECQSEIYTENPHSPPSVSIGRAAFTLLHDVFRHSNDGVDARYRRLTLSTRQGNQAKQQLIAHGLVSADEVKIGRTRRVALHPTDEARTLLGMRASPDGHESLAHDYWKHQYAKKYEDLGYTVEIEALRNRETPKEGRVDVKAEKAGGRASESVKLAIEIETGKSDVVANVRRDLVAGFSRVLVVATDEDALDKIERQLGRAGLIVPGRVDFEVATARPAKLGQETL